MGLGWRWVGTCKTLPTQTHSHLSLPTAPCLYGCDPWPQSPSSRDDRALDESAQAFLSGPLGPKGPAQSQLLPGGLCTSKAFCVGLLKGRSRGPSRRLSFRVEMGRAWREEVAPHHLTPVSAPRRAGGSGSSSSLTAQVLREKAGWFSETDQRCPAAQPGSTECPQLLCLRECVPASQSACQPQIRGISSSRLIGGDVQESYLELLGKPPGRDGALGWQLERQK